MENDHPVVLVEIVNIVMKDSSAEQEKLYRWFELPTFSVNCVNGHKRVQFDKVRAWYGKYIYRFLNSVGEKPKWFEKTFEKYNWSEKPTLFATSFMLKSVSKSICSAYLRRIAVMY